MLSQATLSMQLRALTPTNSEAVGIDRFVAAYKAYFAEATVDGVAVTAAALAAAETAMRAALAGINGGGGAAKFQAAIVAWWAAVNTGAGAIWTGHSPPVLSVTPPPGLTGLAAVLEPVFAANMTAQAEIDEATDAIATTMHTAHTGGVAAVGPPSATFPIV